MKEEPLHIQHLFWTIVRWELITEILSVFPHFIWFLPVHLLWPWDFSSRRYIEDHQMLRGQLQHFCHAPSWSFQHLASKINFLGFWRTTRSSYNLTEFTSYKCKWEGFKSKIFYKWNWMYSRFLIYSWFYSKFQNLE